MSISLDSSSESQGINNPPKVNHKETRIENLFELLGLQSFDGKFLPNKSFYKFFYKKDLNDFINLKQEIEKEMGKDDKKIAEILSTCISMSYLKVIMSENFEDEFEMCYEKAEKALKKMVGNDEKRKIIIEKAEGWIQNWVKDK